MGFFAEIANRRLIKELEREYNTDVLLFGVDGFTYFGNLQAIDDCRIAILTPAINAETSNVEILTPGGDLREVSFLRLDLWTIVGKGTGIASDPIDPPATATKPTAAPQRTEPERQESHHLIQQLCRMIGDCVAITTLGGFLFDGILGAVDDELAILTVEEVFGPGNGSSISGSNVRSAVVNLEAITSVSSTTTSCS